MEQRDATNQSTQATDRPRLTRRAALARLLGGGTLLALAAEAGMSAEGAPDAYADAGPVPAFKTSIVTRVVLPMAFHQEVVYVVASGDRSFAAFSARCTHRGCVVAWDDAKRRFLCPCHGGQFDGTGKPLAGPPTTPLRRLKIHRHKGRLLIEAPPPVDSSGD